MAGAFAKASATYLGFWVPQGVTGTRRIAAARQAGFTGLSLLAQPSAVYFAVVEGAPWWVFLGDALALLGYLGTLSALRAGVSPRGLGHVYAAIGTGQIALASWGLGGLFGAVPVISLLVPVSATLVVGPGAGWLWLVVQGAMWAMWATYGDDGAAAARVTGSLEMWKVSILFALGITGVLFQAAVSLLYQLEDGHRRELVATLAELEDRVIERTAELQREVNERREAEARAQLANRAKSAFLANMSHELRTPVTAVIGYTELVHEELGGAPTEARDDLSRVLKAARHLLGLIDSLLDLARVESGVVDVRPSVVSFSEVVVPIVDMIRPHVRKRGNEVIVEVDERGRAFADPSRTRQILLNLLSNANKFTENGRIRLVASLADGRPTFEVSDTGSGIAPEQLDTIFERFAQVHEARVNHPGGTGLGLTISRQLAERMGGALCARSELGKGSVFVLTLPAVPQATVSSSRLAPRR